LAPPGWFEWAAQPSIAAASSSVKDGQDVEAAEDDGAQVDVTLAAA
jgi:hypothetical protein